MLSATNRNSGQNVGFPDVCNTPTGTGVSAPIPYTNTAQSSQATGFATTVKIEGANAITLSSSIPSSSGDEAGTDHPVTRQEGRYTTGNPKVRIEGMPAITLACPTTGNSMNNASGAVVVPSAATVFFTLRTGSEGAPLSPGEIVDTRRLVALAGAGRGSAGVVGVSTAGRGIAVLRIARMCDDVCARVHGALQTVRARILVVDLRGNPGGDLDGAIRLAGDFLPWGAPIAVIIDRDGDRRLVRARSPQPLRHDVVLLVDGDTASAAELFAGSLQQLGRATIAGTRTRGKATIQTIAPGPRGDAVYQTVARFELPGGADVEGHGITPDVIC